jgi:hypothetical protein
MFQKLLRKVQNKLDSISDFFEELAELRARIARDKKREEELSTAVKKYMQDSGAKNYNIAASGKFLQEGYEVSASMYYPSKSSIESKDVIEAHGQEFFNENATISKKALEETLTEEQIDALVKKVTGNTPTLKIDTFIPHQEARESEIPDLGILE